MTAEHLHILRHSLGVDHRGHGKHYRNRFITDPQTRDGKWCLELVAMRLMQDNGSMAVAGGMHFYSLTDEGVRVVRETAAPEIVLNRAQKRYKAFLKSDCGEGFGEWLKRRYGKAAL